MAYQSASVMTVLSVISRSVFHTPVRIYTNDTPSSTSYRWAYLRSYECQHENVTARVENARVLGIIHDERPTQTVTILGSKMAMIPESPSLR